MTDICLKVLKDLVVEHYFILGRDHSTNNFSWRGEAVEKCVSCAEVFKRKHQVRMYKLEAINHEILHFGPKF